jgi:hypothetical protein
MTDSESTAGSRPPASSSEPLTTLRGGSVSVDARRVRQVIVGLCMIALAALVIIFTIVGVNKNSQINRLHHDGVPINVTISGCSGLLGGSGSNVAGYACNATYSVHGHRYSEPLPGTSFYKPGATVHAVVVPSDPALVSPVSVESNQHASASVFIVPGVLLVVLVLLAALVLWLRRRSASAKVTP